VTSTAHATQEIVVSVGLALDVKPSSENLSVELATVSSIVGVTMSERV
jgi:hypothetical protein